MHTPDKWAPRQVRVMGRLEPVLEVRAFPAGMDAPRKELACPIREDLWAVLLVTESGARWFGFNRAWIDSHLRMRCQGYSPWFSEVIAWENAKD